MNKSENGQRKEIWRGEESSYHVFDKKAHIRRGEMSVKKVGPYRLFLRVYEIVGREE